MNAIPCVHRNGEEYRPHHSAISQRVGVAVREVGDRVAVITKGIAHKGDGIVVRAKRGAREQQPARTALKCGAHTIAPGFFARRVVDLVQHHDAILSNTSQ